MLTDINKTPSPSSSPIIDAIAEEQTDATLNALDGAAEVEEVLEDLSDDDLLPSRPRVEMVPITLPNGTRRKLAVRRFTSDEMIDAINSGADSPVKRPAAQRTKDTIFMKLRRCLVNPKDNDEDRFTDVQARDFIKKSESDMLNILLAAIHGVNPLLKNV